MPKVDLQYIQDSGFRAEQFGTPDAWDLYVKRLTADAEAWVRSRVGASVYASPDAFVSRCLVEAERCWCRAELWRRRAAFLDSNAFTAMGPSAAAERRTYHDQAAAAQTCAEDWVASALAGQNVGAGNGVSLATIETGPFRAGVA